NVVLGTLVTAFSTSWPARRPDDTTAALALYLRSLARLQPRPFAAFVDQTVRMELLRRTELLQQQIKLRKDAPWYWRQRAFMYIDKLAEFAKTGCPSRPDDIPGAHDDRQALLQSLIGKYAEL